MLYLYLGSIVLSYIIAKSSINNFEHNLIEKDLNTHESNDEKIEKSVFLLVISIIPVFNLIISIGSIFSKESLYNTFKQAKCEQIIQDNEKLLNKYERVCNSGNELYRRALEKEINKANNLIVSGFNKEEVLETVSDKRLNTMLKKTSK